MRVKTYTLGYPQFDFIRCNSIDEDVDAVYGYILSSSREIQIPCISLIATGLFLRDSVDAIGRHTVIDDVVFPVP